MKTDVEISSLEESERHRGSNFQHSLLILNYLIVFIDNSDPNISYEYCSEEVKAKIEGIKLMVRWLYGMKLNTLIGLLLTALYDNTLH